MKKIMKMLLLAAIFTLALSVSAFAAGSGEEAGICDVTTYVTGVTVSPEKANGTAATKNASGVYVDAERVEVTFSGATASKYYLVVALDDDNQYPTVGDDGKNNVAYINQETASGETVSFDVYPKALVSGQTYNVYISSNDGSKYTKVASFSYYAPYKLGDVNDDGAIDLLDAMLVLQHEATLITLEGTQYLAADVGAPQNSVDLLDAMLILQYEASLIDSFSK